MDSNAARTRHPVEVVQVRDLAPHMRRVRIRGEALATMPVDLPGQWVKVFFPSELEGKPHSRAYTIRRHDPVGSTVDLDFVLHGDGGEASRWASRVRVGDALAVAGPREGFRLDPAAAEQIFVGDSTALPAIAAILETLPDRMTARVFVEVTNAEETALLPKRAASCIHAFAAVKKAAGPAGLLEAPLRAGALSESARAWVAGEANMVRRVHVLLGERGLLHKAITASGYWRAGFADHRDRDESEGGRDDRGLATDARRPRRIGERTRSL